MSIGERLKKEREKKGFTLDDVHSRLRIHPTVLSNLEENNFQALPAAVYTKGFLKRYGEFLEMNPEELLSEYDSLKIKERDLSLDVGLQNKTRVPSPVLQPTLAPAREPLKNMPAARKAMRPPGPPASLYVKITVLAVCLATAVFAAVKAWEFFAAWASRPQTASAPRAAAPKAQPPRPAAPGTAASSFINAPDLGNFPKLKPKTPLSLSITASTEAWLRVLADGQNVFEAILRPGQTKEWTAQQGFELKLGRPAGVTLALNGYSLGSPDDGQAKQVVITHEGMARLK